MANEERNRKVYHPSMMDNPGISLFQLATDVANTADELFGRLEDVIVRLEAHADKLERL